MSEQVEFTPEMQRHVVAVWQKIQGSSDLLDGLLFGEFDEFIAGVLTMMQTTGLIRYMPLGLIRRGWAAKDMEGIIEYGRELLRNTLVKEALDNLRFQPDES